MTPRPRQLFRPCAAAVLLSLAQVAWALPTCSVASVAELNFGVVVPLASTGNISSNTGSSFWINCSADVGTVPLIYSPGERVMHSGEFTLPFTLSMTSPGGPGMPSSAPGVPLSIVANGTNRTVPLYGRILANDFKGLPAGHYSEHVLVTVEY